MDTENTEWERPASWMVWQFLFAFLFIVALVLVWVLLGGIAMLSALGGWLACLVMFTFTKRKP